MGYRARAEQWCLLVVGTVSVITVLMGPNAARGAVDAPAPNADGVRLGVDTDSPIDGVAQIEITRQAYEKPQVAYSVRLPDVRVSEQLRIRSELQFSRCNDGDFDPGKDCKGYSDRYGYAPQANYRIVYGTTATDKNGPVVHPWDSLVCNEGKHHCPAAIRDEKYDPPSNAKASFINVVVAANDPAANQQGSDRLVLENDPKGRLSVFRLGSNRASSGKPADRAAVASKREETNSLRISPQRNNPLEDVVYQKQLRGLTAGDLLDVRAEMRVRVPSTYDYNPLIGSFIILSRTKSGTDYTDQSLRVTSKNGSNCVNDVCTLSKAGGMRVPDTIPSDGKMWLNFVGYTLRDSDPSATPTTADVLDGGELSGVRYRANSQRTTLGAALPLQRTGAILSPGELVVSENGLGADWVSMAGDVKKLALAGERVGALMSDGRFLVKEGSLSNGWTEVLSGVTDIALAGDRIGALTTDGRFFVKEGALWAGWTQVDAGVKAISLAGDRIGSVHTDNRFYVKQGALWAAWTFMAGDVSKIAMAGSRIGVLSTAGGYIVKEGALTSAWTAMDNGVSDITLTANRVGALHSDGMFWVKEGELWQSWVTEINDARAAALSGTRIAIINQAGQLLVKQGALTAEWGVELEEGATDLAMAD